MQRKAGQCSPSHLIRTQARDQPSCGDRSGCGTHYVDNMFPVCLRGQGTQAGRTPRG